MAPPFGDPAHQDTVPRRHRPQGSTGRPGGFRRRDRRTAARRDEREGVGARATGSHDVPIGRTHGGLNPTEAAGKRSPLKCAMDAPMHDRDISRLSHQPHRRHRLMVVAAVIALPHLAGRADETPPTAPPIAGAALPARTTAAAAEAPDAPSEPPLQRLVPPSSGSSGVSNPELPRDPSAWTTGAPSTASPRVGDWSSSRSAATPVPRRLGARVAQEGAVPMITSEPWSPRRAPARRRQRGSAWRASPPATTTTTSAPSPARSRPTAAPSSSASCSERALILVGRSASTATPGRLRRGLAPCPPHASTRRTTAT